MSPIRQITRAEGNAARTWSVWEGDPCVRHHQLRLQSSRCVGLAAHSEAAGKNGEHCFRRLTVLNVMLTAATTHTTTPVVMRPSPLHMLNSRRVRSSFDLLQSRTDDFFALTVGATAPCSANALASAMM